MEDSDSDAERILRTLRREGVEVIDGCTDPEALRVRRRARAVALVERTPSENVTLQPTQAVQSVSSTSSLSRLGGPRAIELRRTWRAGHGSRLEGVRPLRVRDDG